MDNAYGIAIGTMCCPELIVCKCRRVCRLPLQLSLDAGLGVLDAGLGVKAALNVDVTSTVSYHTGSFQQFKN